MYSSGTGVHKNPAKAFMLQLDAAEHGDDCCQFTFGATYQNNNDYSNAVFWFRKSAEQKNARGQYALGLCYMKGAGVPQDDSKAFMWFSKAAEQGDANAQYALGALYEEGVGTSRNIERAKAWFSKAAEQGNAEAQEHLKELFM